MAEALGIERVNRLMLRLSLPAMILMLLHALLGILDTWFIARLGAQVLAAVTLCHPVQSLLLSVAGAAGTGINSLMSRTLGQGNCNRCNNIAWHTLILGLTLGGFFTWAGFQCVDDLLWIMGAGPQTLEQCRVYLMLYLWAVPGIILPTLFSGLVVGEGNTVLPLAVGLVETVLDVLLDSCLIRGFWVIPPLGIRGAAVATILSQSAGAFLYIFVLRRRNTVLRWKFRDFSLEPAILWEIFRVGLPGLIPEVAGAGLMLLFNRLLMNESYCAVAALGLCSHIRMFCLLPVMSLARGSLPLAGFAFGARQMDRLKEIVLKAMTVSLFLLGIGWFLVQIFPGEAVRWFSEDGALVEEGAACLKLSTLFLPLAGPGMIFQELLQVTGMSLMAMGFSLLRLGLLELPFLLVGASFFGVKGVWLAVALTDISTAALLPLFLRIFWQALTPGRPLKPDLNRDLRYVFRRLQIWLRQ